jgi:cytochrome b561
MTIPPSPTPNRRDRYDPTLQALHWLSAALMAAVVIVAWYMTDLPRTDPGRNDWYGLHKSIGVTILALSVIRLGWRHRSPPAPLVAAAWEHRVAAVTHVLLYLILLAMPITGYIHSAAGGHPVSLFGLFTLPTLVPEDKALGHLFGEIHEAGQWAVYLVVALHAAAALFHAIIRKDGVLRRMLPAWLAS